MANFLTNFIGNVAGGWTYLTSGGAQSDATGAALTAGDAQRIADHQPGGVVYNRILATQGQAAADAQAQATVADYQNQVVLTDALPQEQEAGVEGAQEGLDQVTAIPGEIVGSATSAAQNSLLGIFSNIPWWVYASLVLTVFLYFGGAKWLKKHVESQI